MEGRELPPEPLIFRNPNAIGENGLGKVVELTGSKEGDWDKTAKEFNLLDGKTLDAQCWIFVCTERDRPQVLRDFRFDFYFQASTFYNHLKEQANRIGAKFGPPVLKTIPCDMKSYFISALQQGVTEIYKRGDKCQMVFCLLPNRKVTCEHALYSV